MRLLGRMTAVDTFFGNLDRVVNGNVNNWFYDPQGVITLIDHVDPGANSWSAPATKAGYSDPTVWDKMAEDKFGDKATREATAAEAAKMTVVRLDDLTNDKSIFTWYKKKPVGGGPAPKELADRYMAEGIEEGRKQVIKVFSSTRWNALGKSSRAAKKSIKVAAASGAAEDGAASYYGELKRRATWLKNHA